MWIDHDRQSNRVRSARDSKPWRIPEASGPPVRRPLVLLTAIALALLLYRPGPTAVVAESMTTDPGSVSGDLGPVADWLDDIIDTVEEAKEALEDAESESSSSGGWSGQIPSNSLLAYYLDRADLAVSRILDPLWYPSLNPSGAGEIDGTVDPGTLAEYASTCRDLADEAFALAVHDPELNAESIGSKLKTIQHLLPGYRKAANLIDTMEADVR